MSQVEETEKELVGEQERERVKWQLQVEKKCLAGLLGDEEAVAPLSRFLKTTKVGGSKGAKERELVWERTNDQEGENLLG